MGSKKDTVAIMSDVHVPFHDPIAVECALQVIRDEKPATIYLNGDIVDFYMVSDFSKDPKRGISLQEEVDQTVDFLDTVRRAAPKARIVYIQGNHEDRLRRYLWKHSEIASLRSLDRNSATCNRSCPREYGPCRRAS